MTTPFGSVEKPAGAALRDPPDRLRAQRMQLRISIVVVLAVLVPTVAAKEPETTRADAMETFQSWCAGCHGKRGDGRGVGAALFSPPPRNFTDCASMATVPDEELDLVIRKGGHAVGKSTNMWAWEDTIPAAEIAELVRLIRSFCR